METWRFGLKGLESQWLRLCCPPDFSLVDVAVETLRIRCFQLHADILEMHFAFHRFRHTVTDERYYQVACSAVVEPPVASSDDPDTTEIVILLKLARDRTCNAVFHKRKLMSLATSRSTKWE